METKKKILIIDDEQDICESSKELLERTGRYEVMFATQALPGLNLARNFKPELIILDIIMPDMEGSELAAELTKDKATRDIPVLFLTAIARREELDNIKDDDGQVGGHFFMAKPVTVQELVERIETILHKRF